MWQFRTKIVCQFPGFIAKTSSWIKWYRGNIVKYKKEEMRIVT